MLLRWLSACVFVGGIAGLFVACGEESQTLCEPGTEVFCKCRGGYEGTKTCNEDGATFGECTTAEGTCPEIPDTTSSSSDTSSTTSGSGGGSTGTLGLYEACTDGSECQTGTCDGFCTRSCTGYQECIDDANMLYGDCVKLAGGTKQLCAPYCASTDECSGLGADVKCGGAVALDDPNVLFGVCAVWGDELMGMPPGTPCDEAEGTIYFLDQVITGQCNLGNTGAMTVCYLDECLRACFDDTDCPAMDCSSNGSNPGCCATLAAECGVQ